MNMEMAYALVTYDVVVPCSCIEYHAFQDNLSKKNVSVVHSDLGGLLATYVIENDFFKLVALQWEKDSGEDYVK